ncbi:hypothetical protein LJ737_00075 [Hymenobacter sp. 15J16-1T3B]|uniref:hypothetical protein n=1 Tax=Hymenobacter sp. 15J16-1T3B TaxID=2886941 RepID=UPI001D10E2CC|nr:hypothetical protein [Hymenobacter sp. 15J16-1T3B]MCC3155612.1 hypothetical protein [Hymenobacter sp. 15J16-1T3B]
MSIAWRALAGCLLLAISPPAYALGDMIIPQTIALIVGVPLLLMLFGGLFSLVLVPAKTLAARINLLLATAALGTLFNAGWLYWLLLFEPATWSIAATPDRGWLGLRFLLPLGLLAAVLSLRGRLAQAALLLGSCLLVWMVYRWA